MFRHAVLGVALAGLASGPAFLAGAVADTLPVAAFGETGVQTVGVPAIIEEDAAVVATAPAAVPQPVPRPKQAAPRFVPQVVYAPVAPARVVAQRPVVVAQIPARLVRPVVTASAAPLQSCQSLGCPRFVLVGVGY